MSYYGFLNWGDAFKKEAEERLDTDFNKLCNYGIVPLDDALLCIQRGELVVIGADSGVGKTEIAIHIASHNAKNGKKVAMYHLEGGFKEAISRMKWKDICKEYFENNQEKKIEISYQKWVVNHEQDPLMMKLESDVWSKQKEKYNNNLFFYNSKEDLTIDDFLVSLLDFHSLKTAAGCMYQNDSRNVGFDLDLIVIDHLQYFSLNQTESEISEITNIIRQVKKITENYHIPVVLISHLRKKGKERGLPDQQDFYGSSNIPKISNTSITITPRVNKEDFSNNIFPTWIRVVKSRVGIRSSMAMLCNFDGRTKSYERDYEIYKVNNDGFSSPEPLSIEELPRWANHAKAQEIHDVKRKDW